MDIEGAEYEVFCFEPIEIFSRFSVLAVEFHGFRTLGANTGYALISSVFEKLFQNFKIVHAHPNNITTLFAYNDILVPNQLEVTFLRDDWVQRLKTDNPISLPHALDKQNVLSKPDMAMREMWWKQ